MAILKQYIIKRRCKKSVLVFTCMIPGIEQLYFFNRLCGCNYYPVMSPFTGDLPFFIFQVILVNETVLMPAFFRNSNSYVPEFIIQVGHSNSLLRVIHS